MNTRSETTGEQPITKLAAMAGRWKFEEGRTVFEGPDRILPYGFCLSNVRFLEGEARVTVQRTDARIEGRILLGYRSPANAFLAVGIGPKGYSIAHFSPAAGWRSLAWAGLEQDLPVEQPIKISVKVRGQRISLEVDDVPVLEHVLPTPLPYGQLGLLVGGKEGKAEFTDFFAKAVRGDVFVSAENAR
jgi:hypothetical protein